MRDGIIIQERPCPRCAIRRTARLAYGTSFCFNCRLQWPTRGAPLLHSVEVPSQLHVFAADELARLSVYRAAVRNGFYTDCIATSPHEPNCRVRPTDLRVV
jgi:hypothetical protein